MLPWIRALQSLLPFSIQFIFVIASGCLIAFYYNASKVGYSGLKGSNMVDQTAVSTDWVKAAEMHQRIVQIGWDGIGNTSKVERSNWTWWDANFGSQLDGPRPENYVPAPFSVAEFEARLPAPVVAFLKTVDAQGPGGDQLFYYMYGIHSAASLFDGWAADILEADGFAKDQFIMLYAAADPNHAMGIMYNPPSHFLCKSRQTNSTIRVDLHSSLAFVIMSRDDQRRGFCGRYPWVPLEQILGAYLEMIEQGRIKAIPYDHPKDQDTQERMMPWAKNDNYDIILSLTLKAWEDLVSAIKERMPTSTETIAMESEFQPLLPDTPESEALFAYTWPPIADDPSSGHGRPWGDLHLKPYNRLIRSFLSKASKPNFKFIAPGLLVPSFQEILDQPFQNWQQLVHAKDWRSFESFPILLFRSECNTVLNGEQYRLNGEWGYPWSRSDQCPTGFYLYPESEWPDSTILILPFAIGRKGFARTSDGVVFEHVPFRINALGMVSQKGPDLSREPRAGNVYDLVHQHGWNHIRPRTCMRLMLVLERWRVMVEQGWWVVGEEGVEGGVRKWKDADEDGECWKYSIAADW
jgi:hypothetical protein